MSEIMNQWDGKLNMNDVKYFFALWGLYFRQLFLGR